jgi:hypothetical protein
MARCERWQLWLKAVSKRSCASSKAAATSLTEGVNTKPGSRHVRAVLPIANRGAKSAQLGLLMSSAKGCSTAMRHAEHVALAAIDGGPASEGIDLLRQVLTGRPDTMAVGDVLQAALIAKSQGWKCIARDILTAAAKDPARRVKILWEWAEAVADTGGAEKARAILLQALEPATPLKVLLRTVQGAMKLGQDDVALTLARALRSRDPLSVRTEQIFSHAALRARDWEGAELSLRRLADGPAASLSDRDLKVKLGLVIQSKRRLAQKEQPEFQLFFDWRQHKKINTPVLPELLARFSSGELFEAVSEPERLVPGRWFLPVWLGSQERLSLSADVNWVELLGGENLSLLKERRGHLLLDYSYEPFHVREDTVHICRRLEAALDRVGLCDCRVVILNSNLNSRAVFERATKGLPSRVHVLAFDFPPFIYVDHCLKTFVETGIAEERRQLVLHSRGAPRRAKFLSYNNKDRPHRAALFATLYTHDLLAGNLISYRGPTASYYQRHTDDAPFKEWSSDEQAKTLAMLTAQLQALEIDPTVVADLSAALAVTPLVIDSDFRERSDVSLSLSKRLAFGADAFWPYLNAYVHIGTNTVFQDDQVLFFTQNFLKPLFNFQPVIFFGDPHQLRHARAYGFETFPEIICEEYDEIVDPAARLAALLKEVRRLGALSHEELDRLYWSIWPKLQHNHDVLLRLGDRFVDDFRRDIVEPLQTIVH